MSGSALVPMMLAQISAMVITETKSTGGSHDPRYEVILGEIRDGEVVEKERVVSR